MKYYKWIYKDDINKVFKLGEELISNDFSDKEIFSFSDEERILRTINKGDTLCEVIIPIDAKIMSSNSLYMYNSNKIVLDNIIDINDSLILELYKKSKLPKDFYYDNLAYLAIKGCYNTCLEIIRDIVNMKNIDKILLKYKSYKVVKHVDTYEKVLEILEEIKDKDCINICIDRDPLVINISKERIINLTGQSGAGKSFYANKIYNSDDYLVIDTDDIFSDNRYRYSKGINKELGDYFRKKYKLLPNLHEDFDLIYKEIIDYARKYKKIIVIDCAQFHEVKDIKTLMGQLVVIRTSIDKCYKRCINRYKKIYPDYSEMELDEYKKKKMALYSWYKQTNKFIKKMVKEY